MSLPILNANEAKDCSHSHVETGLLDEVRQDDNPPVLDGHAAPGNQMHVRKNPS